MLALEHLVDLRCSPCRFLAFQLQNRRLNSRRYLTREPSGPARKIIKSLRPVLFVALLKFVAGLARDSKFPAQIRHPFARLQTSHKLHSFVHCGNLFPGHGPSSTPLKVLPMSPVIFVTYVSGLHLQNQLPLPSAFGGMIPAHRIMKQPLLGIFATILVIIVSLGFISLFDFPFFAGWLSYCLMCVIPMQIVIGITWGTNHPGPAAKRTQPAKGVLLSLTALLAGIVVA